MSKQEIPSNMITAQVSLCVQNINLRTFELDTKNKLISVRIFQEKQEDSTLIAWTKINFTKRKSSGKP